jgi:hypothetical protein
MASQRPFFHSQKQHAEAFKYERSSHYGQTVYQWFVDEYAMENEEHVMLMRFEHKGIDHEHRGYGVGMDFTQMFNEYPELYALP